MFKSILKGIILFTLVMSSIVLTYKIWNFRPNLANIETSITKNNTALSPKNLDNINSVFLPYQVISYSDNHIYGTADKETIFNFINRISGLKATEITNNHQGLSFTSKLLHDKFIMLDYAGDIPVMMYQSDILNNVVKGDSNSNFNRIIIDSHSHAKIVMYMLTTNNKMIEIETNGSSKAFNDLVKDSRKNMEKYTGIITNEKTTDELTSIYVPEKPTHTQAYSYLADNINVDDINKVVLGDKNSIIERSDNNQSKTYNSNTGIVKTSNNELYKFNNLSEVDHGKPNPMNNLINSFNFISEHRGFTDDYRYFGINQPDSAISYQMFFKGYPVFNERKLSEIYVIWGDKDVYEYKRGLYTTSVAVPTKQKVRNLPTAEEVRFSLASSKQYQFERVSNMMIGYRMERSDEETIQSTLSFKPAWFIKYNDEWKEYDNGRLK
ncbi:YycH family regulatory protein [Macrococcus equi]|uniref:YycH family regulatory protein n=1 Tax=Macrococcus equi TaxID=3395462 RepID=UPI0039BDE227